MKKLKSATAVAKLTEAPY